MFDRTPEALIDLAAGGWIAVAGPLGALALLATVWSIRTRRGHRR